MAQPREPRAGLQAAQALLDAERYRAACTAFAQFAETDGHRAEANRGWGQALAGLDNYDEAASRYEAAIEADPGDEATYGALKGILDELSDPDALMARIQRKVDGVESAAAHAAWANFLADRNKAESAITEYEKAAQRDKRNAAILRRWGDALAGLGRHEEALERYESAIRLFSSGDEPDEDLFSSAMTSLGAPGTPESHIARMQEIVDGTDNCGFRLQWARTLYATDRAAAGAAQYGKALAAQPDKPATWLSWGEALDTIGMHEEAILKYEKAIELDPISGAAYEAVAATIANLKSVDAAIARIQGMVDKTQSATAHSLWAGVLSHLKRQDMALAQFEAAFRCSKGEVSYGAWAATLNALGRHAEAATKLLAGIRTQPGDPHRLQRRLTHVLKTAPSGETVLPALQREVDEIDAAQVYAIWGRVLASLGKADAALEQYQKAALKNSDDSRPHLESGSILAQQGKHNEALLQFAVATEKKLYSEDVFNRIRDSLVQVDAETRKSVIETLQANVDRGNQSEAYLHWGQTLSRLGEYAAAIQQHEQAVNLDPENPNLHVALGLALGADRKFARAVRCYGRAVTLSAGEKTSLSAALEAFKSAFAQLDSDQPVAAIGEAIEAIDSARTYREWGLVLGSIGRPGAELAQYEKAVKKHATNSDMCAEYAYRLVAAGQSDKGLAQHRLAAERQPENPFTHRVWGLSLSQLRLYQEAVEKFERAAELKDSDALFNWASTLEGMGSFEAAVEKYRECIQVSNDPVDTAYCLHNIANIRERQGDYRAAAKAWDAALAAYEEAVSGANDRTDANLFFYYGSVYQDVKHDFEAAAENYAKALERQPKNSDVLAAIAKLNVKKLEYLSLDGRNAERTTEYHWTARDAYGKARKILTRLLEDLTTAATLIKLGDLHLAMSEDEEARTCLTKALAMDKESAEALALLGRTYLRTEEFRNALNCARAAAARDSQNLAYRTNLAEAHYKLNELDKAETEYRKVLAVAPCHIDALIGLGNAYVALAEEFNKSGKPSDAENMFSRALDQFSQSTGVAGTDKGSRQLSPVERAALSYSRGYANVMRYEAQTLAKRDEKLLESALGAFDEVPPRDPNYHKAQRAKLKIKERTQPSERSARWGAWIIVLGAFVTFLIANVTFLLGRPGLAKSFQVTDQSVQLLKAAKAPDDVVGKLQALAKRGAMPKAAFDVELKSALGDELTKKFGDMIREQASAGPMVQWQESLETGYYALLSFGALMFMVAGLYLQQLSKLKFGGIELEKTTEAATKVIGSLGITK